MSQNRKLMRNKFENNDFKIKQKSFFIEIKC